MNQIDSCRICMKARNDLNTLTDDFRELFFEVTLIKLIKLENCSNSICSSCSVDLKKASEYRSDLIKIQQKIFQSLGHSLPSFSDIKLTTEFFQEDLRDDPKNDPINFTTSIDPNTILIKEEVETLQNSFNLSAEIEGSFDESENGSDYEDEERFKVRKRKRRTNRSNQKGKSAAVETIHCDYCDKPIKKYYYKIHMERVHQATKSFICDICNHQSNFKSALEVHMTKHFNIKPFECRIESCDMKFKTKKDLRVHVSSKHGEAASQGDSFICETCGKSFRFKKSMEIHVRSNHTLERPFKCDEPNCTAAYFCNTNLITHKKRAHSFETVTCEVCGKTFNSLINLNEHVRKNHKEGQHVCPAEGCGRKFITPYYLNLHAKTHYGIRDRECQWCGQRFFNKKHLNQHVEVAHKKSRFYCQVPGCTSVFSRKCNIREHVKKIHRELSEETKQQLLSDITKMKPIYMVEQGKEEKWISGNQQINNELIQNVS